MGLRTCIIPLLCIDRLPKLKRCFSIGYIYIYIFGVPKKWAYEKYDQGIRSSDCPATFGWLNLGKPLTLCISNNSSNIQQHIEIDVNQPCVEHFCWETVLFHVDMLIFFTVMYIYDIIYVHHPIHEVITYRIY